MTWTTVLDASLAVDAPARSSDIKAIRDNITAQANGDSGAPQNQNASIANGVLGAEKFQTGTTEGEWIAETYGATVSVEDVGTYAMVRVASGFPVIPWFIAATSGSNLRIVRFDTAGNSTDVSTPTGTWKNFGVSALNDRVVLALRIS
jgi:hypothetical protein